MFHILSFRSCPLCHFCLWSWSIIANSWILIFFPAWEEFYCWISVDSESWSCFFVLSSIQFCNFHLSFQIGCKGCPFRGQSLAMTTPWSIELYKPCGFISKDILIEIWICEDYNVFFVGRTSLSMRVWVSSWRSTSNSTIGNLNYLISTFLNYFNMKSIIPFAVLYPP
jgi:hypothetical protein